MWSIQDYYDDDVILTYYSAFLELSVVVSKWRAIMMGIDEFILISARCFHDSLKCRRWQNCVKV